MLVLRWWVAGRVHMAAPSMAFRRTTGIRRGRNSNKHKRLFEGGEGSLPNGEKVRAPAFSAASPTSPARRRVLSHC